MLLNPKYWVKYWATLGNPSCSCWRLEGKPPVTILLAGVPRLGVLNLTAYLQISVYEKRMKERGKHVRKTIDFRNHNLTCLADATHNRFSLLRPLSPVHPVNRRTLEHHHNAFTRELSLYGQSDLPNLFGNSL